MRRFLAALLLCFTAAAPVAAAPVTINSSSVVTEVYNGTSSDSDVDTSTAYGTRTVSSAYGGASSTTYIDWQDTGAGALFNFDFAQVRTGAYSSYARTLEYPLSFTVGPSDTSYSLSGLYSMTGSANTIYSYVHLYDSTTSTSLFRETSHSRYTANEIFNLGVIGDADYNNDTVGSLTGTLLAGHTYRLHFDNYIQANPLSDAGATATGCVTLSIGGASAAGTCAVAPVPLPAAAWLLLSGLGGLGFVGRRRKAA